MRFVPLSMQQLPVLAVQVVRTAVRSKRLPQVAAVVRVVEEAIQESIDDDASDHDTDDAAGDAP